VGQVSIAACGPSLPHGPNERICACGHVGKRETEKSSAPLFSVSSAATYLPCARIRAPEPLWNCTGRPSWPGWQTGLWSSMLFTRLNIKKNRNTDFLKSWNQPGDRMILVS